MDLSRRHFLRMAGYGLGATALSSMMERLCLSTALAQGPDYKALVCVFLQGGNDGNNTVIPYDTGGPTGGYNAYSSARQSSGLAIARNNLLQIASSYGTFGLHPNLPDLQGLYNQRKMAIVCNVGPLVQPLDRNGYMHGSPKPFNLFSHSDQVNEWETSRADIRSPTGWGGRIADLYSPTATGFPILTFLVSSAPLFATGLTSQPLGFSPAPTALNRVLVLNGFGTSSGEVARRNSFDYLRTIDLQNMLVNATSTTTQQGVNIGNALSIDPTLQTQFPNTTLGNQLKQVAKLISANQTQSGIGLTRQIFFAQTGSFDTHSNELTTQASLLTQVSQAVNAFYNATVELGVSSQVTTFTISDFSRTLQPSGSGSSVGSDHAWGNHQLVIGDSVRGGDFYGIPTTNGTPYQTLQYGGPDDTDTRGRWIPSTAVEQYGATLASWYGVGAADLNTVFPLLGNFPTGSNLGFMM
jgi:uncharacterized protein (DUF1501 family)